MKEEIPLSIKIQESKFIQEKYVNNTINKKIPAVMMIVQNVAIYLNIIIILRILNKPNVNIMKLNSTADLEENVFVGMKK